MVTSRSVFGRRTHRLPGSFLLAALLLGACAPQVQAPITPTETSAPPAATPTSEPTVTPTCPEPAQETTLLQQEQLGYCLLYPADYVEVHTEPDQVCLVQGETNMLCHSASAFFNVEDAAGRSAAQVADEITAGGGVVGERSSLTISGGEAVVLPDVRGQASSRIVLLVRDNRLYRLAFGLPDDADPTSVDRFELLYDTVVESFTLLPVPQAPESTEADEGVRGSAVVVFVEEGNVVVWEEATGQSQTIVDSGDAIRVELSDDADLVAFVRRSHFSAGGVDQNEQSALWVVGRDGSNPRELVSADQLRLRVNAAQADSTNFPRLDWIPNTHRLLYSGNTYDAHGYGEGAHTPLKGVFQIDADTLEQRELAPIETSYHFVASPDGRYVALVDTNGVLVCDVDRGRQLLEFPAGPIVGEPGYFAGAGVWTQDSRAFVITAVVEPANVISRYEFWRVPVDGSPAEELLSFPAGTSNAVFAPDGSRAAVLGAATAVGPSAHFLLPLPESLGPLAVPGDTFDYSHFTWSPAGSAYILERLSFDAQGGMHGRRNLFPLCPNAFQDIEVCGPAIPLGEQVEWLEWVDRNGFLFVTYQPRRLYFGSLDGTVTPIAEDPQSFDAAAATCRDDSEFVADVTVPDGTPFAPGTYLEKTWRIRNTGACAWDASYRLTFLSGDRMSGPRSAPLGQTVQPGEEADLSILLMAPAEAGTYRGLWTLFAPDGTPFGTRPYVSIEVP